MDIEKCQILDDLICIQTPMACISSSVHLLYLIKTPWCRWVIFIKGNLILLICPFCFNIQLNNCLQLRDRSSIILVALHTYICVYIFIYICIYLYIMSKEIICRKQLNENFSSSYFSFPIWQHRQHIVQTFKFRSMYAVAQLRLVRFRK